MRNNKIIIKKEKNKSMHRITKITILLLAILQSACLPEDDAFVAPWPQNVIENNAYDESQAAGPFELKANSLDEWNEQWHQPYYGAQIDKIEFKQLDNGEVDYDEMVNHIDGGDSALHTGYYLASQSFRYHVTKSPIALENIKNTVQVLSDLLHVTGRRGYLARFRVPRADFLVEQKEPGRCESKARCHYVSEGPYSGDIWMGHTSRDMYKGWMFGMATAYDLIDDPETKDIIRTDVHEVVTELMANAWTVQPADIDPYNNPKFGEISKVTFSLIAYHMSGDAHILDSLRELLKNYYREKYDLFHINDVFPFNKYSGWYANQLEHMDFFHLLRLGKFYFSEDDYQWFRGFFNSDIHTYTRLAHSPFLNMVYMSQGGWQANQDDAYFNQLIEDFSDLSGAPATYTKRPGPEPGSYTLDPFSLELNEIRNRLLSLYEETGIEEFLIAANSGINVKPMAVEPLPIRLQRVSPQYQANPFQVDEIINDEWDGGSHWVESGQTYLVPYWMARYYGFIGKDFE